MSFRTRTICLALFTALLAVLGPQQLLRGAASPLSAGVHPRLLLSPDELPALRAKLAGPLKPQYQEFVSYLDSMYGSAASDSEFYYFMRDYAFVYAAGNVTGISYGRSMNDYGAKAVELLRTIAASGQTGDPAVQTMAMTYDWVFPLLAGSDRTAVVAALKNAAFKPDGPGGGRSAFHHREIKDRLNYILAGLAYANDGVDDADASAKVGMFATYVSGDGGVLRARNFIAGSEGGVSVGQSYAVNGTGGDGLVMTELQFTEAWRTANGLSLTETYSTDNSLRFYPQWMTYALTPYENSSGDYVLYSGHYMDRGTTARGFAEMSTILGSLRLYEAIDPSMAGLAQWLMDTAAGPVANSSITGKRKAVLANFIFNPGNVVAKSPDTLGLPLSKWFRGTGWLAMRTGWTSTTDTLVTFTASPFTRSPAYANSNHGSFTIDRGGPLAIHAGRGVHHAFSDSSRGYNTITFPDPNEPVGGWPQYWDMGGQRTLFKVPSALSQYTRGSEWDIGGVRATDLFEDSASHDYDYVASNLTRAYNGPTGNDPYNTSKVKLFTRQFVYFRREGTDGPDRVIVFDRTETTGLQFDKRWMFHPPGRDDGARSFVISGHSSVSAGPSRNGSTEGKKTYIQPDLVTVTNNIGPNNGRLFWKPLLPANRFIVEVGGPNSAGLYSNATSHEYETAYGKQDIDSGNYGSSLAQWVGQYSLELQPATRSTYDVFLNVLEATTPSQSSISATALVSGSRTVGAAIGQRIAVFNRLEGYITQDSLVVPSAGTYRVLFCDLQPGMVYIVNGVSVTAGAAGTAYATVTLSAPNSTLQIAATGAVVQLPPGPPTPPTGLRILGRL